MKVTTETSVSAVEVIEADLESLTIEYEHTLHRVLELLKPIEEHMHPGTQQRSQIVTLKECSYKLTGGPTVHLGEDWQGAFRILAMRLEKEHQAVHGHLLRTRTERGNA